MERVITTSELRSILSEIKGCTFVSMEYTTTPTMSLKKQGKNEMNPLYNATITKVVSGTFQFNYTYQNAVNNRLLKNGCNNDYISESLRVGKWIEFNKFIETSNKDILVRFYKVKNKELSEKYYINGKLAKRHEIFTIQYFGNKNENSCCKKQLYAGLETVEQVKPINISIEKINSININGKKYIIK